VHWEAESTGAGKGRPTATAHHARDGALGQVKRGVWIMQKIIEPLSEELLFSSPEPLHPGLYQLRLVVAPGRQVVPPRPESGPTANGGRHVVRKSRQ
jgi:hypothetical protein